MPKVAHRALRGFTVSCLILAAGASVARAGVNGEPNEPPVDRGPSPAGYSLTYDNFVGTCDATGFSTTADGHVAAPQNVSIQGRTELNGTAYDTFAFGLPSGTYSFATGFARVFGSPQPSANWVFVFFTGVNAEGKLQGTSITTFTCANGVFSGTNEFRVPIIQAIPTLSQVGLVVLGLLITAGAIFGLRRRRAA